MCYLVEVIQLRNTTDNCDQNKKPCVRIGKLVHSIQRKLYGNTNGFDANNLQSSDIQLENSLMLGCASQN